MIPWEHLDTGKIPGGGELRLKRRGKEYSIMLGTNELMNSRLSGSEEALANVVCTRIQNRPKAHMLIGGLGMGFTLRAALAGLPADARITVAELVPAVIAWARGPMAEIFAGSLDDPRVTIHEGDVAEPIDATRTGYDAILLDVDNGPEGLTSQQNDGLYHASGLRAAYQALRPNGILAVWSAGPDNAFTRRLQRSGFSVEEIRVRANKGKSGARHVIWIAERPA